MRELHMQEYKDYLKTVQGSIHKILPLYEELEKILGSSSSGKQLPPQYIEARKNLVSYVLDWYDEVEHVLNIIEKMPHGAWYFSTKSGLKILAKEVAIADNHKKVKKKVMHITGIIQHQIREIKE